jgi:23S rRNA pseudouridine2605 synthase
MGYMVKPGDVVNFDGATLRKKGLHLLNKPKNTMDDFVTF